MTYSLQITAQSYPQGYFRNPLNIPIMLAGNFGECRPNHYHSGLDIKTEGRENMPVYAAADGYVSRIKMQNGGFGHALYLSHPNGYTTLYAHLNDFAPAIQQYMKAKQYEDQDWQVDISLPASKFPVKKGDLIAYSGNTGGSTAPHLHFEIRDAKTEHPLNPLLFGFQVKDNIAPVAYKVAVYDMERSTYEQTPLLKPLLKKGNRYVCDTIVVSSPITGIGIEVLDFMNDSKNTLTFYTAELFMDNALQCRIRLDDIGYDVTRYLHAMIDYKTRKNTGTWLHQFFLLKGNRLKHLYENLNSAKGALLLDDMMPHQLDIKLTDALGNTTDVQFYIRFTDVAIDYAACEEQNKFEANRMNKFNHPNVKFTLDDKDLYDDVCFAFSEQKDAAAYSARYTLKSVDVPVHGYFGLHIKPDKPIPFAMRDKVALIYNDGKDVSGKATTNDNGWYKANVRAFGEYRLVADTTAPKITPVQGKETLTKASRIVFRIKEETTSVDKCIGKIDGKWVPFEQAGDLFFYTFDEHCTAGNHELVLTATDENNNTQTLTYKFKR